MRQVSLGGVYHTEQIGFDHQFDVGEFRGKQAAGVNDASDAEDQIDAAEVAGHGGCMIEHRMAVGDINRVGAGPPAGPAALPGSIVRGPAIPVRQGQVCAPPCQAQGQRPADTRPGSGDHGDPRGVVAQPASPDVSRRDFTGRHCPSPKVRLLPRAGAVRAAGENDGIRAAGARQVDAFAGLDGRERPPTVRLALSCAVGPDPDADDLTPAEARELACALLEAARIAES